MPNADKSVLFNAQSVLSYQLVCKLATFGEKLQAILRIET